MQTTNLFVELLLIGLGAAIWVALLGGLFGIDISVLRQFTGQNEFAWAAMAIGFLYILGIVTDRVADQLIDKQNRKLLNQVYEGNYEQLIKDRAFLFRESSPLVDNMAYGRSRMRICRGWVFNLIPILVLGDVYLIAFQVGFVKILFFNLFLLLLMYGFYFAWKKLTVKEYGKVKKISAILRDQE